jgi:hypothetical protein
MFIYSLKLKASLLNFTFLAAEFLSVSHSLHIVLFVEIYVCGCICGCASARNMNEEENVRL